MKREDLLRGRVQKSWDLSRDSIYQKLGRADVVVFKDRKSKDPNKNAYIITEVKRENRKDGIDRELY